MNPTEESEIEYIPIKVACGDAATGGVMVPEFLLEDIYIPPEEAPRLLYNIIKTVFEEQHEEEVVAQEES